jgi:hypothetical protein
MGKYKKLIGIILIVFVLGAGSLFVFDVYGGEQNIAACERDYSPVDAEAVMVRVFEDGFEPSSTLVGQCDTIVFINESDEDVHIAFGEHDDHYYYPGYSETIITPDDELLEIVLRQSGDFKIHDHYRPDNFIEVTVEQNETLEQYREWQTYGSDPADGVVH